MIITRNDINQFKPLTVNAPEDEVSRFIEESERMDLRPLLGELFYRDVLANKQNSTHELLMSGGEYTHKGETYYHPGLRRVAIEYFWARYTFFGGDVSTGWGMVQKQYRDGVNTDRNRLKEIYKESMRIAASLWRDVVAYLERVDSFEKWNACREKELPGAVKLNHIR